ncbi:MAG: Glu/Leu/Phe/Val dehydrogenase dimerization domain-containing protein [Phycisphaerales bacterium]|nr:Glu/Leu/Phe/Val dehydrogenase dimerization domain-containing protein [Phycisphaerales bacterium]MDP7518532.1 Glu/Leu/Phe/Val dehydrogenase dimerization domain-containing protein [Phycisphaerales bacterium]
MHVFGQMIDRGHERVCFHRDVDTGLRAIIAIHSTKLGPALGGTRRWHYATEEEAIFDVLRLSEGMSCKAACAGLPMGGAKSVILLPEHGHPITEAEARAMGRFVDTLSGDYIAAEDVGLNPQFIDWMAMETDHAMGGETVSTGGDPSPFTAQGTFNAMKACLRHRGKDPDFAGLSVAVQGLGHVGMDLCRILHEEGALLTVADIDETRVAEAVASFDANAVDATHILQAKCDILAPCALGAVIGPDEVRRLQTGIVCGAANNILVDPAREGISLAQEGVLYAPDFVANAGGLIWLAGLHLGYSREELDRRNEAIEETTLEILDAAADCPSTHHAAIAVAACRFAAGPTTGKEPMHAS